MIYLDYAASFPPFPEVISEWARLSAGAYANPGAIHKAGCEARAVLQNSRRELARLLQVRPEEIFFTSGATEANNWAVKLGCAQSRKRHILCAASEHKSVLESVRAMERSGWSVTMVNPDSQGRILPQRVLEALRPDTGLICVQAVNNETGVVQDVDALADLARKKGILYFCDAVQSFGHVSQNLHKTGCFSLSAHKLGGPRGVGCLVIRYPNRLRPLLEGGGQELGLRSGTENLPAIAGFALAANLALQQQEAEALRLKSLRDRLESGLKDFCPDLTVAGGETLRSPGILCCGFPGITGEEMAIRLDRMGIQVSPGAACSARSSEPSHVLLSMGLHPKEAGTFLRFSLGPGTTPDHIHTTIQSVSHILS